MGAIFNTSKTPKVLIQNQLIDYIRAIIGGGDRLTHLRRIADSRGPRRR